MQAHLEKQDLSISKSRCMLASGVLACNCSLLTNRCRAVGPDKHRKPAIQLDETPHVPTNYIGLQPMAGMSTHIGGVQIISSNINARGRCIRC